MRVIDAHMHYGTDRNVASHTCVPYLITGEPESVIRLLDEENASHGVLFPLLTSVLCPSPRVRSRPS